MNRAPRWSLPPSGPQKSEARASVTRARPASWAASASAHMRARMRPLLPVAARGVDSVIGPSTGP